MEEIRNQNEITGVLTPFKNGTLISDEEFDLIYSPALRKFSTRHWTPVNVAYRAARLLTKERGTNVLDVGSGVGKFCFLGAITTHSTFVGVEQRKPLIEEAERVRNRLGIKRAEFIHANMMDLDWSEFNAFYFYNPFYENVDASDAVDASVLISFERYESYVGVVRKKLRALPIGTRVATYHGFGGKIPDCYELATRERIGNDYLKLWIKTRFSVWGQNGQLTKE